MSAKTKPGYDTLVFFWCAIFLWVIGIVAIQAGAYFLANGTLGVNIFGLTAVHVIGLGCYFGAGIFSIMVGHKVIAMLIYLVHNQR